MIINLLLGVLQVVVNVLLAPLSVLNFGIDIISSISIVQGFIKVVAYLFPWNNLLPLISFVIGMFVFRAIVALIKTIWALLPML